MKLFNRIIVALVFLVICTGVIFVPKPVFYSNLDQVSLSTIGPNETITIDYEFGHWSFYKGRIIFTDDETRVVRTPLMKINEFLEPYHSEYSSKPRKMQPDANRRKDLDQLIDRITYPCASDRDTNSLYGKAKISFRKRGHITKAVHINDYDAFLGNALYCLGMELGDCSWSTSFSSWGYNAKKCEAEN